MAREMKDSRVEWIGEIPREWKTIKNKYMLNIKKAKLPSEFFTDSNYIPYMSMEYIRNPSITPLYAKDGDFCSKEDILLLWDGSNAGEIIFNHPEGFAPSTTAILKQKRNMNKIFFQYYLKFFEKHLKNNSVGMGIPHVNGDILKNSLFLVPPLEEQEKIANYLDKKVSDIDLIIEKTKATIEDYKKYKQSIITEAVTKGINPNVEMKDSGIEWIGEIPREWEVKKLKNIVNIRNEKYMDKFGKIKYYGLENIESKSGKYIVTENIYDISQSLICKKGDLIFGKLRPYLAKAYLITEDISYCSSEFAIFYAKEQEKIEFIKFLFLSIYFIEIVNSSTYGTKMPRANIEFIENIKVPVPPLKEQNQIAEYLDKKTTEIDTLITKKEALIAELEEYKKSLIYECVTGKKEIK